MLIALLRHGEAEARASRDAERALTAHGQREVASSIAQLKASGVAIQRIIASPYRRAQESAVIAAADLGLGHFDTEAGFTPDESPEQAMALCGFYAGENILVVSHMPLVARLAYLLAGEGAPVSFATGQLCLIDWPGHIPGQHLASFEPRVC